tara:strand:- start:334 stop:1785 length:1452 start_codon:yes stop_codon:yes gene_type:complete
MNNKLINNLKKKIFLIICNYRANVIQNCVNYSKFTGNDIDVLYDKNKVKKKKFNYNNTIIQNKKIDDFRLHLNNPNNNEFLSLDIEEISNLPSNFKKNFIKNFNKKFLCKKTMLCHLDRKSIIFYKLYKYFNITISSYSQLFNLKKEIDKLEKKDFMLISNAIKETLPNRIKIINKFLLWNFNKFQNNRDTKKFFSVLKLLRHKKRKIYAGNLNFKNLIFCKKFIYSLVMNSKAKWKYNHNPMPAIAIVGNDGSGKTTISEYIRKNFSKMDPLIIDMKSTRPFFILTSKIRNFLKILISKKIVKKIFFLNFFISFFGETIDILDKYIKYRIGMAWADSGLGLTVFERYPTDRVRGEFPNKNYKFLPLEQYFPFPDGMVYLDVSAPDTLKRKKNYNHSIAEMTSKRKNYLSLIDEFDEVEIIKSLKNINQKISLIKNYIFKLYVKKKNMIKKKNKVTRMKWKKNFSRTLSGSNLNKKQKESFLI